MALNLGTLTGYIDLDASGFESTLGGVFDKLKESKVVGAAAAAAVGGAIGMALASGVSGAMDFEAANDKLAAQLGAPKEWAADLGKAAGDLYSNAYGDSLETVNDALKNVLQNGVAFEDATSSELEGVTAKVLDLSTAFDQDLGGVTRAVGQMMKTGMAKDANEALDIVTRGFQEGVDKSDDFLDTLNEYGTQFRKLGIDGTTATGLLVQGIKAGARDSDIVADAIKEFSIRAVDGSTTTAAAFKGIGLNAKTMSEQIAKGGPTASRALALTLDKLRAVKDPAKQAQLATGLFGTQAEDLGKALYALHPETAAARMGEVAGAATKMGKTLNDNARTNIESFRRKAQQAFVNILGNKALPVVNDVAETLANDFGPALHVVTGAVKDAAHWFSQHQTTSKILLGTLVALVAITQLHAAVLAVQSAGGLAAYLKGTKAVTAASKVWAAVQWLLNAAMSANPIALVVIAIAALVAGIIIAYKHSETFRDIVKGAFEAVGKAGTWLWDHALRPAFKLIVDMWMTVVGVLVHGAATAFGWVPGIGPKLRAAAAKFDELRDHVNNALDGIKSPKEIRFTTPGADAAVKKLAALRWQQDHIDPTVTVRAYTRAVKAGHNAAGTSSWRGGLTWVGENGPELIDLQQGAAVYSNAKSRQIADRYGSAMGGQHIQVDVHPAPGMDEEALGVKTARRLSMLAV